MKKFAKITAIGLSCAFAFSLAACGGDDDGKNTGNAPNPNGVKTEQVTEPEWQSAFDFSNVTNVTFKLTEKYSAMGMTEETYDLAKFDGNKIYVESLGYDYSSEPSAGSMPQKVTTTTYYSVGSTSYVYEYNKTDKKWEKEETDRYPRIDGLLDDIIDFADMYSSFTYTASKNAYVATDIDGMDADTISVKITDGKVSVVQMDMSEIEDGVTMTGSYIYQAYDIGATSVALPKVAGDEEEEGGNNNTLTGGSEVNKAQWNAAISASAFRNVTFTDTMSMGGMSQSRSYKFDDQSGCIWMYDEEDDETRLIVFDADGDAKIYILEDKEWQYNGVSSESFDDYIRYTIVMTVGVFDYDSFTYGNGKYTARNYTAEGMAGVVCDEVTLIFEGGNLIKCEYSAEMQGVAISETMEFTDYGETSLEAPNVDDTPGGGNGNVESGGGYAWDTRLNGTYYRYSEGDYDYGTYLQINDGKIVASVGPAEVEVEKDSIVVRFYIDDEEYGVVIQEFRGTIKDGEIIFTYLVAYDKDRNVLESQDNAHECYRIAVDEKK